MNTSNFYYIIWKSEFQKRTQEGKKKQLAALEVLSLGIVTEACTRESRNNKKQTVMLGMQ